MSIDTEEAIEKLADYRSSSKKIDTKKDPKAMHDSPIRTFFLKYYWLNVIAVTTLFFAMLIGGWSLIQPIWVISSLAVLFVITRQTYRTMDRLKISSGRDTRIDDVFVILLVAGSFYLFSLFALVDLQTFISIHVGLTVVWFLQIVFVNFLKPEAGIAKTSGIIEKDQDPSKMDQFKEFMTVPRAVVFALSLILAGVINFI
ncbi:MAG: hypothetical protein ACXAE3_13140 [Candidatus Kariarchaeaceae archaeon]